MSTIYGDSIELREGGSGAVRLRISLSGGDIVFQTFGAGLRFVSAEGVAIEAPAGPVSIVAGQDITTTAASQAHQSAAGIELLAAESIALSAGTDIDLDAAANIHQTAGELHRTEAKTLDLHATEKLREDANGVGHTYAGDRVDYWLPWHGTGNRPAAPEHPYEGTDDLDWPPIDGSDLPPAEGSA